MDKIIGRALEKEELSEAFLSNEAEFIAVYGRRRVGKTYLIKNFFQGKKCIYFQTTGIYKGSLDQQLSRFSKELGEAFYGGASIKKPGGWMEGLEELHKAINKESKKSKIVIFFDELPWMATRRSGVISALEYFWNRHWSNDSRIKLIVCGSAASWLIKNIVRNKGGLHNRLTRKIRLMPFDLHETNIYLKYMGYTCNYHQVFKLYSALGGIPFYLNQIKKNYSVDQNIDYLFFNSKNMLFNEFEDVFSSLFENSEQYQELVTLIGEHKDGIQRNTLDSRSKLTSKGGRLTTKLEDLENAGFITSYVPYAHKKLGIFYRISDEYCYFYLKWVKPIKNQIKQNKVTKYWKSMINTPAYFNWLGYVFENACSNHLEQIKKALKIDESSFASPWRYTPRTDKEKGAQIDLLFDRGDSITLCEIKYTEKPFTIDKSYAEILKRKIEIFKTVSRTDKQLFLALISANGLKENLYSKDLINDSIKLDSLFERAD